MSETYPLPYFLEFRLLIHWLLLCL